MDNDKKGLFSANKIKKIIWMSIMFKIVKKAIDEFNPFALLPESPNDEFDSETSEIVGQITDNSTVEEIAEIIAKVFSDAFDEKFETQKCMTTAEKIYKSMKNK